MGPQGVGLPRPLESLKPPCPERRQIDLLLICPPRGSSCLPVPSAPSMAPGPSQGVLLRPRFQVQPRLPDSPPFSAQSHPGPLAAPQMLGSSPAQPHSLPAVIREPAQASLSSWTLLMAFPDPRCRKAPACLSRLFLPCGFAYWCVVCLPLLDVSSVFLCPLSPPPAP